MNSNTFRQWERYCDEHHELTPMERLVLLGYVRDHSAAESRTHPGERRLVRFTGAANTTVARITAALVKGGHLRLIREYPRASRRATEYSIPWLRNPIHEAARLQIQSHHLPASRRRAMQAPPTPYRSNGNAPSRAALPGGCPHCGARSSGECKLDVASRADTDGCVGLRAL